VKEYQERMSEISGVREEGVVESKEGNIAVKESVVMLDSVNVTVDGYSITISKSDVIKLMEIFYQFDK
tara:strand:+ start:278 stop:481 length:204 start_codon:yes stop_codon:yes gene_type:complete